MTDLASVITPNDQDLPEASVVLPNREGTEILEMGPAFALGESAIASSSPRFVNGEWQVELELQGGALGLDAWNDWTARCFNRAAECATGGMAIVLDHRVVSAPVPQTSFFNSNQVLISGGVGGFSETEATDLAKVLQYGSTPVEMKAQAVQTVSATLGQDSLRAGVVSGLIGIGLVLLFMFLYYRSLAWICAAGLAVTAALIWSIIGLLSQTSGLALTLAGITGIIVSIGVTVDSYVVFFERLKDEVHSGKTFRSSAATRLQGRVAHDPRRQHRVADRCRCAVVPLRRRRPWLRVLPRALHPARHDRRLLLHPAGGAAAQPVEALPGPPDPRCLAEQRELVGGAV